jgi:hypothetical protein
VATGKMMSARMNNRRIIDCCSTHLADSVNLRNQDDE